MPHLLRFVTLLAIVALIAPLGGCSGQQPEELELAEQEAPPAEPDLEAPPPPPRDEAPAAATARRPSGTVPEERSPAPTTPSTVTLTVPEGTMFSVALADPLTSETAVIGDVVTATLKGPIVAGDRIAFPAGSRVEGKVIDVKPATKGFKDTGGAIAVAFDRIVGPDGRKATIMAGFTKVAEGSAGKKGAIIGGSAAGGAVLGKLLGKDAKGAAVIGGAIGTAVAGATKGREAVLEIDEEISMAMEQTVRVTVRR